MTSSVLCAIARRGQMAFLQDARQGVKDLPAPLGLDTHLQLPITQHTPQIDPNTQRDELGAKGS